MGKRRRQSDGPSLAENFADLKCNYDIANDSRYRRKRIGVSASGSGADYHNRTDRQFLASMELARDLFRNNVVVGQGIRRLVANIIQDGFKHDPQTGNDDADAELAGRWKAWSEDREQCDRAGELTFHGIEKLVLQHRIVDGDHIVLPTKQGSLQLVEAHRMRTPGNTAKKRKDGSMVVHGVRQDKFRRRLEYWLTKEDLNPMATLTRVSDIRAYPARDQDGHRQVFHIYDPDRASQTRGMTALAPSADTAGMGDDLFFAQLVKAQVSACYTIMHEMAGEGVGMPPDSQHGQRTTETRPDGTTRTIEGTAPGMEIFGFPGEKLQGFSPNIPNAEFFHHAMLILTFIAINLDLPLAVLLLDPTKTNFSGWRGAMDQARMRFRAFQKWMIDFFHRPVRDFKIRQWIAGDPVLQKLQREIGGKIYAHEWNPPRWPYIEPLKDSSADVLRLRHCLTSQRRRAAERGENWGRLSTEICEDNGLLIRKAAEKAQQLNKEFPELGVTWREVISLPTADGVSMSLDLGSGSDNQKEQNDAS